MDVRTKSSIIALASLLTLSGTASAQALTGEEPLAEQNLAAAVEVEDVEEINDDPETYLGRRISVSGEVEDTNGVNSFILESGGWFDDDIAVFAPASAGVDTKLLAEDTEVALTGTVHAFSQVDVENEFGWDLDPELEVELEDVQYFIVADAVVEQTEVAALEDDGYAEDEGVTGLDDELGDEGIYEDGTL